MKALIVYKKSTYELYSKSNDENIRKILINDPLFSKIKEEEHSNQGKTLEHISFVVNRLGINSTFCYRANLNHKMVLNMDLIISVGGDGTFLEVNKYINSNVPVLAVNSDPNSSIGFYSFGTKDNFEQIITNLEFQPRSLLRRFELTLDGKKLKTQFLNDVVCQHNTGYSKCTFNIGTNFEKLQKYVSSGIIISSTYGSTGFIYSEKGELMDLNDESLQFISRSVRNAKSKYCPYMIIKSETLNGRFYIDGIHENYTFTTGSELIITKGTPINLVGNIKELRNNYFKKKKNLK